MTQQQQTPRVDSPWLQRLKLNSTPSQLQSLIAWHQQATDSCLSQGINPATIQQHWKQAPLPLDIDPLDLLREVEQRTSPLRQQWQARGPGILRYLNQALAPLKLPPITSPTLLLPTLPYLGGGSSVNHPVQGVMLEALLYDPNPLLPELARLTCGLTSAFLTKPLNQQPTTSIDASPQDTTVTLIAVVAAICANSWVELLSPNEHTLALALDTWHLTPTLLPPDAPAPPWLADPTTQDPATPEVTPSQLTHWITKALTSS